MQNYPKLFILIFPWKLLGESILLFVFIHSFTSFSIFYLLINQVSKKIVVASHIIVIHCRYVC